MAASRDDLIRWFDAGVEQGATHMVVVCDEYDWDDYPVYVEPEQDARTIAAEYNAKSMQKVMEVYNLSMPKAEQMDFRSRVFNY